MITAASAIAVLCHDESEHAAPATNLLQRRNLQLRAELDEVEPLISAALLVTTAFRLRDHDGLLSALRLLVEATDSFEASRCA
jgi:hypothetical protein